MVNERLANDIFLSMINEGGWHDYHVSIAQDDDTTNRLRSYHIRAKHYGRDYARRFDTDIPGKDTVRLIAIALDKHYQEHLRDLARNA